MQSLSSFRQAPSNIAVGIEIEGICSEKRIPWHDGGSYRGFFYITTDGSLSTYTSPSETKEHFYREREWVSQPLTPSWLKKELKKFGEKTEYITNDSCGIHIHISREWCTIKRAKEIYAFYCGLSEQDRKYLFGRYSNDYCRTLSFGVTRYNAVNVENKNTVELRFFASGDWQWACYCVDMATWLVHNAKHLNVDAAYAEADRLRKVHSICTP
jgi:hypothetical protein